jgi:uncharacterized protein YdaU (DUF1376 family)
MSKAPWFKLWAADFLSDNYVDAMTAEQIGWYCILLIRSWNSTPKGYLANDKQLLSKWCKDADPLSFEHRAQIVLDRFQTTPDGAFIYHPRIIEQVVSSAQVSEKRAIAGRVGGLKQKPSKCLANALHSDSDSDKPIGDVSQIVAVAKAYPKLSHLKDETEIPYATSTAIIQGVEKDGFDVVLQGTTAYAKSLDDPKFAVKPYEFFTEFQYRKYVTTAAPRKWKVVGNG